MGFAGFRMRCGGRCCKDACAIHADDFEDGTLSGMATTGDVTETGGSLVMAGASTAIFDTELDDVTQPTRLLTFPQAAGDAAYMLRLNLGDADDTFFFGKVEISGAAGTISVGRSDGGVQTVYDSDTLDDVGVELLERATACLSIKPRGEFESGGQGTVAGSVASDADAQAGWASPDNILLEDGVFSVYTFPSSGNAEVSSSISARSFPSLGSIPAGSTIDQVKINVKFQGGSPPPANVVDWSVLLTWSGGTLSDNEATLAALPAALTDQLYTFNNLGQISQAINDPTFGITFVFRRDAGSTGGNVNIDVVELDSVTYTTPAGRKYTVRFSYINAGDAQRAQCVTEFTAFSSSNTDLKAGLEVESGTVDFSAVSYEYGESDDHPGCGECECEPALDENGEPIEGDSDCPYCEEESTPQRLLITIEGITSACQEIGECPNLNHTRATTSDSGVGEQHLLCGEGAYACIWQAGCIPYYTTDGLGRSVVWGATMKVGVAYKISDGSYWLTVDLYTTARLNNIPGQCPSPDGGASGGVLSTHWGVELGSTPPNCILDLDGVALPNCLNFSSHFDASASTATVEVIG